MSRYNLGMHEITNHFREPLNRALTQHERSLIRWLIAHNFVMDASCLLPQVGPPALQPNHKPAPGRLSQLPKHLETRRNPPTLNPCDTRLLRSHPLRQLLLRPSHPNPSRNHLSQQNALRPHRFEKLGKRSIAGPSLCLAQSHSEATVPFPSYKLRNPKIDSKRLSSRQASNQPT
jgi:hypothetical protein